MITIQRNSFIPNFSLVIWYAASVGCLVTYNLQITDFLNMQLTDFVNLVGTIISVATCISATYSCDGDLSLQFTLCLYQKS